MLRLPAILLSVVAVDAAIKADEVTSLPGWEGALPSKHYSGYLPARGGENHVHYYLTLSENDPATDPIVLWSNGGPGCTSLKGSFEELGQLVFNASSTEQGPGATPTLYYNPLGWTQKASMLYFEHPTGVGFSYCDSCLGNSSCHCQANDTTAALDNYDVITGFFAAYPEFKKNDFYITGESYAGIYIPMLMGQILDRGGVPNLKGAAIGNGCTGNVKGVCAFGQTERTEAVAKFYYGKGDYSTSLYNQIMAVCPADNWTGDECDKLTKQMNDQVGPHNLYNMDDFCPGNMVSAAEWEQALAPRADGTMPRMDEPLHRAPSTTSCGGISENSLPLGQHQRWCGVDPAMMQWLEVPAVQEALHVRKPKGTETNNLDYKKGGADDLTALYKRLAQHYRLLHVTPAIRHGTHSQWIYNGQEDGCVPYNIMEDFAIGLGFPVTSPWHPWFGGDLAGGSRVAAGYSVHFGGDAQNLAFLTIKGAGHEVPTYKPAAALSMFSSFLNGTRP